MYLSKGVEHKFRRALLNRLNPSKTVRIPSSAKALPAAHRSCYTNNLALSLNIAEQETRFAAPFRLLKEAVDSRAFPSASIAILYQGKLVALRAFGRYTFNPNSPSVSSETIFDLASVSKVVATTTAAAILCERGILDLNATVPGRSDLTIRSLLTHTSGLPAYIKFFEQTRDRDELLRRANAAAIEAVYGARTEYSDIGFIILGDVIEKLAGESLDQFCRREIFERLEMADTRFNPPPEWRDRTAPTADDQKFRLKLPQGEVNDENAWVMNGVAGHAGVFSTALDVAIFANCWLSGGTPILRRETVAEFTRQQPGTERALGWDRPTPPSSSGQYFSPSSFGHLGYTGTSLWCDPKRQLAIVLLTNRTWPDSTNQAIKNIRPLFHDAIVTSL